MRCFISSCNMDLNKPRENGLPVVSSHRLPKNALKRLTWLKILDPSGTKYSLFGESTRVCSLHFNESDFRETSGKRSLLKDAVPSRRLGPAARLPPADLPGESHNVFLDESMMAWPDQRNAPITLHSTALEVMQTSAPTGGARVKTIRYAGDLKDDELPYISPDEAQAILPKVYRQLQRTKLRLNCYKQQNLRLRRKVELLTEMINDMRDEQDGTDGGRSRSPLVSELKAEAAVVAQSLD